MTEMWIDPLDIHKLFNKPVLIHGYRLKRTCFACPEQYDVYAGGVQVAYFRLRHGQFKAYIPDYGGYLVYEANTLGDGAFDDSERVKFLTEAILAVQASYLNLDILSAI